MKPLELFDSRNLIIYLRLKRKRSWGTIIILKEPQFVVVGTSSDLRILRKPESLGSAKLLPKGAEE